MSSTAPRRKDLFSLKPLLAGLALLLLAAAVFAYYLIPRAAAVSVEQVSQAPFPEKSEKTPDEADQPGQPEKQREIPAEPGDTSQTGVSNTARRVREVPAKRKSPKPVKHGPPVIMLTSPASRKIILSSDPLKLEARVSSPGKTPVSVDFFYSRLESFGASIYNTTTGVQISNAPLVHVGAAIGKPYRLENVRLERGVYSIYGVVTGEDGVRQISTPVTIIVNDDYPADPGKWFPPPASEPPPCVSAFILSRPLTDNPLFESKRYVVQGEVMGFRVEKARDDPSLRYKWRLSSGRIISGQNSPAITVDTAGLGGQTLIATLDMENDKGCRTSVWRGTHVAQSADSIYTPREFTIGGPSPEASSPFQDRYTACPDVREKLSLSSMLFDPAGLRLGGVSEEFRERWPGDLIICPGNKEQFLDENNRLRLNLGRRTAGISGNKLKHHNFATAGSIEIEGDSIVWDLTSVQDTPGDYSAVFETGDACGSGTHVAQTVHITNYCGPCLKGFSVSNLDDLQRDPAALRIDLAGSPVKELRFDWSVSKGEVLAGPEPNAVLVEKWISDENLEVVLDAKAEISGLGSHDGILKFSANLSNFEENYFHMLDRFRDIPVEETPAAEKELIRKEAAEIRDVFEKHLSCDWALSGPSGNVLASGKSKGPVEIDTGRLNISEKVNLSVRITGWNLLFFAARSELADVPGEVEKGLKCNWTVSKGTIFGGRGSGFLTVGGLDLPLGTPVNAAVECAGSRNDCPYGLSIYSDVGRFYGGGGLPIPTPAAPPPEKAVRPAETAPGSKPPEFDEDRIQVVETGTSGGDQSVSATPTPQATPPPSGKTGEREFIKIAWPGPKETVYVNQAFSVIVTYKRSAEALQITDGAGEVVAELKSGDLKRLIKDRFGPGAEAMAQIRLQSAGFYQSDTVTCSPNCQGDYLSLAADEQKWTFNVTAHNPGDHKFNLEMWVKPKKDDPANPPEKVWGREDMKVTVSAETPTRFQIYGASGILGVFGLIFFARGVNFKVMIAGGDIVGGDKVGGHKVGGDMVGGDKIGGDKIDPGGGP